MPDDIDRAQEREASIREGHLADHAHRARGRELLPAGACHFCNEPVQPGRLFCDSECGWAWEELKAARKRNGE